MSPVNGSSGSGRIGPGVPMLPSASMVTCWPAVRWTCPLLPSTSSPPWKSLMTTEPSEWTTTSKMVPLTDAVVVLPTTWKVAPPARCWTVLSVRPILSRIDTSWRLPSLPKCELVSVMVVLDARRVIVPSGSSIWARPLASVCTESPGFTIDPDGAAANAPPARDTETWGTKAVSVAPTLVAACAAMLRPIVSPTMISTMTTNAMMSRRPPRPLRFAGAAAVAICARETLSARGRDRSR